MTPVSEAGDAHCLTAAVQVAAACTLTLCHHFFALDALNELIHLVSLANGTIPRTSVNVAGTTARKAASGADEGFAVFLKWSGA